MTAPAPTTATATEQPLVPVQLARAVQRLLRWTWLAVFVFGTGLWVASFASGGMMVVLCCGLLWFAIGVVAAIARLFEASAARMHRAAGPARRRWGTPVWLLSPLVIAGSSHLQLDARLWFATHRATLAAAAQAARQDAAPPARLGGFEVTRVGTPDVVAFATLDGATLLGYLHDPAGAVRPGDGRAWLSGFRVRSLLELGDGWRAFLADS